MPPIGIAYIGTKCCHFNFQPIARYKYHAKLGPDRNALEKQFHDAFRRSVGRNVIVSRFAAKQKVTHTTAHEQRLMPVALQLIANRIGEFARCHTAIMRLSARQRESSRSGMECGSSAAAFLIDLPNRLWRDSCLREEPI